MSPFVLDHEPSKSNIFIVNVIRIIITLTVSIGCPTTTPAHPKKGCTNQNDRQRKLA